jgi:hypothetical protein
MIRKGKNDKAFLLKNSFPGRVAYRHKKTADLLGGLSGGLVRFCCHWQRTLYIMKGIIFLSRQNQTVMSLTFIPKSNSSLKQLFENFE